MHSQRKNVKSFYLVTDTGFYTDLLGIFFSLLITEIPCRNFVLNAWGKFKTVKIPNPHRSKQNSKQWIWKPKREPYQMLCICKKARTEPKGTLTFGRTRKEQNPRSKGSLPKVPSLDQSSLHDPVAVLRSEHLLLNRERAERTVLNGQCWLDDELYARMQIRTVDGLRQ